MSAPKTDLDPKQVPISSGPSVETRSHSQKNLDLSNQISRTSAIAADQMTAIAPPSAPGADPKGRSIIRTATPGNELHLSAKNKVNHNDRVKKERKEVIDGKAEKTIRLSLLPSLPKVNSADFGRDHSNAGTPHFPEDSFLKVHYRIADIMREIFNFLERKEDNGNAGAKTRHSKNAIPSLQNGTYVWKPLPAKLNKEDRTAHLACLKLILTRIENALSFGHTQFLTESNELKEVHVLKVMLTDNPHAKASIENHKHEELITLWRRTFIFYANPLAERRVFSELAEPIKIIIDAFVTHQGGEIDFLKKAGKLPSAPPSADYQGYPDWTKAQRGKEGVLSEVYTAGLDDAALNEMLYLNPKTINAMSLEYKKFSLNAFMDSATALADIYAKGIAPLIDDPVFEKYIEKRPGLERKELKQLLKERQFSVIIGRVVGDQTQQDWHKARDKLPFALLELAKRARWLLQKQSEKSKSMISSKISLAALSIQETTPLGYLALIDIIQKLAKELQNANQTVAPRHV